MKKSESTTAPNEKNSAQTPKWFFKSLEAFIGQKFDLDVCANKATTKCMEYYSLEEDDQDSLNLPWERVNFCNPPFNNIQPFIEKSIEEAYRGNTTVMLFPDTPETGYSRLAFAVADTVIKMPFRLKFLRPDGSQFTDKNGKQTSPQFSCQIVLITPIGLKLGTRTIYHDFRIGFKD
ncbi:MAG: hypothetical protein HRU18_23535 [Pseudoalteromonas sp.]|uniref:DNA N-6-adenine-methyltransferase n=1 Tax=Pseudoalteromonas sp. TaxID=53249 RepID=UPI001DC83395|nr:DNA N-6-adenine-methyltransferase [Pseudoalteromonas sp.]NRA81183.1 hypothetical protein [Pseudoalteromonas sp.]